MEVSLGEVFDLIIYAKDENGNPKDAVYSYYNPKNLETNPLGIVFVDLDHAEDAFPSFASVDKATITTHTVQKASLVLHNAEQLNRLCIINYQNSQYFIYSFTLSLIDSSNGQVVCN